MKQLFTLFAIAALLTGCQSTAPNQDIRDIDPQIAQFTSSARAAYSAGAIERAARFYEEALDRARVINDSSEIGRNAYNLAACLMLINQLDKIPALLSEAKSEFQKNDMDIASILILDAKLARLQDNNDNAQKIVDQILKEADQDDDRLQAYLIQADIDCDKNKIDNAQAAVKRASRLENGDNKALAASVSGAEGKIFLLKKEYKKAAARFDEEAAGWQAAGRYREMALALRHAGEVYLKENQPASAADHLYSSARSLFAQGNAVESLKIVEQAVRAAEKAKDDDISFRIAALFEEIKQAVEASKRIAGST